MPFLCIAIPTYNRRDHLKRRLEELLPQLTDEVLLCVFDNGSNDGTPEVAAQFSGKVIYRRSDINLGMCRNFMRCFEETEGEWLWILSDDDPVQETGVQKALALIRRCGSGIINFTTSCGENFENKSTDTLESFFSVKDVTSVMYISANLYERRAIRQSLKILAPASFTIAPNVAIMIHALQAGSTRVHLSSERLLLPEANPRRWSGLEVALGLSLFPSFIDDLQMQRIAALGLRRNTRWMLRWGTVEVTETTSLRRWRRILFQANSNFTAYGASLIKTVFRDKDPGKALHEELSLLILAWLPLNLVRIYAHGIRRRNADIFGGLLREFE